MFCDLRYRWSTCDIEDEERYKCILEVIGNETSKAFLPSSVPELQSNHIIADAYILGEEVYSDCGLHG